MIVKDGWPVTRAVERFHVARTAGGSPFAAGVFPTAHQAVEIRRPAYVCAAHVCRRVTVA
jgi:hypothetical protein